MSIEPGSRLGPYEIIAPIGAGGMGTVYRARDTRLSRDVAIKLLPASSSSDPRLRERLAREAHAISALSHPNICRLYDVGSADGNDYLVMELLDGESLAERLARGPLPIGEALRIATEIALALDAAHQTGIVHRDLKPGNVMLTRNGARLLDFGLAKAFESAATSHDPTDHAPLTHHGMIVGTLRYMAPEQLEGRTVDARTDIFAFGLVVYEMLTGRPAFQGTSQTTLITSILTADPPSIRSVNPDVSAGVERIVRRCLRKNPDERWQSMQTVAEALRWAGESDEQPVPLRRAPPRRWLVPLLAAIAILSVAATSVVLFRPRRADAPSRTLRFSVAPPPSMTFAQHPVYSELAVSPDGRMLVFIAHEGRKRKLFVRPFDSLSARALEGTDAATGPFWSADSRWIGFFAGGFLKKIPVDGGPVQTICPAQGGHGSWNRSGDILFFEWGIATEALQRVHESGGRKSDMTKADAGWAMWPSFLPDGKRFLFYRLAAPQRTGIWIGSLDDPTAERLLLRVTSRGEMRGSDLFYVRDAVLMRQKFDLAKLAPLGDAAPVADAVFSFNYTGSASFSVSDDARTIAWQRSALPTALVWRDFTGRELARLGEPELYRNFRIAPGGARVAVDIFDRTTQSPDIWLVDVERDVKTRLTTASRSAGAPVWLHRTAAVVITAGDPAAPANAPDLTVLTLDGSMKKIRELTGVTFATSVTPDDAYVIYTINNGRRREIEMLPMSGGDPIPLGSAGNYDEGNAMISPDQRWLAFESDETGRPEVYIQRFPRKGERIRVSRDGGGEPEWSADGSSLFFIDSTRMLVKADLDAGESVRVKATTPLFRIPAAGMMEFESLGLRHYAVTRDRILVRELPGGEDSDPVTVLVTP